jgi:hypothetical protein
VKRLTPVRHDADTRMGREAPRRQAQFLLIGIEAEGQKSAKSGLSALAGVGIAGRRARCIWVMAVSMSICLLVSTGLQQELGGIVPVW